MPDGAGVVGGAGERVDRVRDGAESSCAGGGPVAVGVFLFVPRDRRQEPDAQRGVVDDERLVRGVRVGDRFVGGDLPVSYCGGDSVISLEPVFVSRGSTALSASGKASAHVLR